MSSGQMPHPDPTLAGRHQTDNRASRNRASSRMNVVCAARIGRRRESAGRPSSRRLDSRSVLACASVNATSMDRVRATRPRTSSGASSAALRKMSADPCSPLASSEIHGLRTCATGSSCPLSVRSFAIAFVPGLTEAPCLPPETQLLGDRVRLGTSQQYDEFRQGDTCRVAPPERHDPFLIHRHGQRISR